MADAVRLDVARHRINDEYSKEPRMNLDTVHHVHTWACSDGVKPHKRL